MASEDAVDPIENEEYENYDGRSGTIFLIDSRISMFCNDADDEDELKSLTRFNLALKCCRSTLMNKIIGRQKDLVGVVLFGTEKDDPKTNTKYVSLLLDLNYPDASAIKLLDMHLKDDFSVGIQRHHGYSNDFLLADALWYCSTLFSRSEVNLDEKRIFLFTDDSNPHERDVDKAHKARKRAKDLNQINISLQIFPLAEEFDYCVFYKELVEIVNGHPDNEIDGLRIKYQTLLERVNRLEFRRRRYAKMKWDLGNNTFTGVSLYTLYREAYVHPKNPLHRATNEPLKRVKQSFDGVTGELLLPSDIEEFLLIGGSYIPFSSEEKEALKRVMEPGITLLGFKPASVVTEGEHCGQPSFIYAEESLVKGSKKLVKALVERCLAKQKVALCCVSPRNRAVTRYVYLIPSEEKVDDDGRQISPCGFHVIPIPFHNETREIMRKSDKIQPMELAVGVAKRIVGKLRLSYKPSSFQNPKLQQFWKHLIALALDYEAPGEIEDQTTPDFEAQAERLDTLSHDFNYICSLQGRPTIENQQLNDNVRPLDAEQKSAKKQYRLDDESLTGPSPNKISRKDPQHRKKGITLDDVKVARSNKRVDKFTVDQLREFLAPLGYRVQGLKKKDLVEAVYNLNLS